MRECIVKLRKKVGDLFMAITRRSFTPEFKIQGG